MDNHPLVSICVVTYNSEFTIIRTLESAKKQTYKNIELIISDDGSIDKTVSICEEWLKNNNCFIDAKILSVPENTGVPCNCNRGLNACKGLWIKLIAGDDYLLPNCICDFLTYLQDKQSTDIIFSNYYKFSEDNDEVKIDKLAFDDSQMRAFETLNSEQQLKWYLNKVMNITPSLFYKRDLIINSGGFNEKYRLFEDTPMIVKLLLLGVHISYMSIPTVMYRVGNKSITKVGRDSRFYNTAFVECNLKFRKDVLYPIYKNNLLFWIREISFIIQYRLTLRVLRNKKNALTCVLYTIFKALNPYYLINYIRHI